MPSCPNVMPGTLAEIAVFHVQIGVAHPATLHFQRRLAVLQRAQHFILNVYGMVFVTTAAFMVFSLAEWEVQLLM